MKYLKILEDHNVVRYNIQSNTLITRQNNTNLLLNNLSIMNLTGRSMFRIGKIWVMDLLRVLELEQRHYKMNNYKRCTKEEVETC